MGVLTRNTTTTSGAALSLVIILGFASMVYAQEDSKTGQSSAKANTNAVQKGSVHIRSEHLSIDTETNKARFEGRVVVRHGNLVLKCERLEADYDKQGNPIRLTATGNVKMSRGELFATASAAIYRRAGIGKEATGTVELTGKPEVWRGNHRLTGSVVRIDLDAGKIDVEAPKGVLDWPSTDLDGSKP